jgi:hypothetical protein
MGQTLRKQREELDILLDVAQAIQTVFVVEIDDFDTHLATITKGRYTHTSVLKKKDQRCVKLTIQHNPVYNIFRNLWLELGESIRSLIIGNYGSIPRSLRWMIESTIFYADMQNDSPNAVDRFNYYLNDKSGLTLSAYRYLLNHISNNNYELLNNRLKLKEIGISTRYKDLVNNLGIFNDNSPNEIKGIPGELNSLYRQFSGLSHISQKSLEEKKKDSEEGYTFFWNSTYDRKNSKTE